MRSPVASHGSSSTHSRIGVEQGLRNHLVRLRAHVALRGADDAASQATLLAVAEGIEDEASALGALGAVSGTGPLPGASPPFPDVRSDQKVRTP